MRNRSSRHSPTDVEVVARRYLVGWAGMELDERARLVELTSAFITRVRWEAARGFTITDEMRVVVGAHAALLVLGFDDGIDGFHDISSVIVHPTTMVQRGPRRSEYAGLMTDEDNPIIGEAHHRGPVLVSWDSARFQARHPAGAENVLLHELAHRLDMLDGVTDGTPLLPDDVALRRWVAVCTDAYERLRDGGHLGGATPVLRSYGATNPAEFFAVATEVFFTTPRALGESEPALYEVLRDYFRQDPARRMP